MRSWFVQLNVVVLCMVLPLSVSAATRFVFTANFFGSSISTYHVDAETGMLRHYMLTPTVKSPSTVLLHPSGRFLYAVSQVTDIIAIYRVDPRDGVLTETKESRVNAGVRSAFQLGVSPDGKLLYVPGRFTQNLMIFRINQQTGALTPLEENNFPTHGDRARFISVTPDGRFVYISNTFADTLAAYRVDSKTESVTPIKGMPFATGDAPQASMMHPSGKFLYVANWRSSDISAYTINAANGVLTPLPGEKANTGHWPFGGSVHPSGKYLYVANAGTSDISGFLIDQSTGALTPMPGMPVSTGAFAPVTVKLDAEGHHAYVPNYDSMDMTVFDIDANNGRLVNPRHMFSRAGVRSLAFYGGDAAVKTTAKWLITADVTNKTISSYAVNATTGELSLGDQLTLADTADDIAVYSRAGLIFVANEKSRRIDIFKLALSGKITRVAGASIALDGVPRGLRVNQRGSHLYVITQAPNEYLAYEIDVINATLKLAEKVTLPADSKPVQLLASPTERMTFVLDGIGNRIFAYVYQEASGPVLEELDGYGSPFATGKGPTDMVVDATGRYGLVVSSEEASIDSYAMPGRWGPLKKVEQKHPVDVGTHPVAVSISPNGRDVYVLDTDKPQIHLLQLDSRDGSMKVSAPAVPLAALPASLTIDPSGQFAYIRYASRAGLTRFEIDVAQGRLTHPTEVLSGVVPSALAFTAIVR